MISLVLGAAMATETPFTHLLEEMDKPWPGNREVRIVFHGHSVPAGYFATPKVDTFNAYPHLFHRALKDRHPHAVINVIVTAIGGENSVQGAARFERDVLSLKPDLIFIDYALNDRGVGLTKSKEAWTSMIEAAKATKAILVLMTPTPDLAARMGAADEPLTQHAEQIRRLALDYSVPLADSYKEFCRLKEAGRNLADYMSQGNHPNRAGHDVVTAKLMELIDP